jgi:hypothetical protein
MPEVAVITYQKLGRFKKSCFFRVFHGIVLLHSNAIEGDMVQR